MTRKYHLRRPVIDVRILLKWNLVKKEITIRTNRLPEDSDVWWALVTTVMNPLATQQMKDLWSAEWLDYLLKHYAPRSSLIHISTQSNNKTQ
jgi:hypothetical protein